MTADRNSTSVARPDGVLPPDESHVWWVRPEDLSGAALARLYTLLDEEERVRHGRYVYPRDRDLYLVTRALVRTVLSGYVPCVAPGQWVFRPNPWGRPEVHRPAVPHGLPVPRFNLSNTHGMVVLAVARHREVGVDVERVDRRAPVEVAHRFFAPAEVTALRALPEALQGPRFFDYWTLKESYIKARGMGLAIPLDGFAFTLSPGKAVTVTVDPALEDTGEAWQFEQLSLGDAHQVALAVARHGTTPATVVLRHATHLEGVTPAGSSAMDGQPRAAGANENPGG